MSRIIGIDYGKKRCGLSVTDTLKIAVHPLTTVAQEELMDFLSDYLLHEQVDKIVFGMPTHPDGKRMELAIDIDKFVLAFSKLHSDVDVDFQDESYTSVEAENILRVTNKKKNRKNKSKLDVLSAVLILQRYLNHI